MAKLMALFALCALCIVPAIASAITEPFVVTGKVFCDYCLVGSEVNPIQYLPKSTVKVSCWSRSNPKIITYSQQAETGSNGEYTMKVARDCGDDICEVTPVKSSDPMCSAPCAGRDRARVSITSNNGMASNVRHANNVAFSRNAPLSSCPKLLQQYEDLESTD